MPRTTEGRAESQPAKHTHSLQKQDSSKYLRGEGQQVTSQENIEKRVANRTTRSKNGLSSQSKPNSTTKVIYKVSGASEPISGPFFAVKPKFGQAQPLSEPMKDPHKPPEEPMGTHSEGFFKVSGHQRGPFAAFNESSKLIQCF